LLFINVIYRALYSLWGVLDTTLCDKVCQWLATGRWFSPGTPVSSTNKTDSHDITEILLKNVVSTIKSTNQLLLSHYYVILFFFCYYVFILLLCRYYAIIVLLCRYYVMPLLCYYVVIMLCHYCVIMSLVCSVQMYFIKHAVIWTPHIINKWNTNKPVFRHQLTFKRKQHNRISYLWNIKHFLPFLTFTRVVFLGLIY
jgi:hypothetical protein